MTVACAVLLWVKDACVCVCVLGGGGVVGERCIKPVCVSYGSLGGLFPKTSVIWSGCAIK
jgi:hypothetical protein